ALVREAVLQARRRTQRSGEEVRLDGVRQHTLAPDRAGAAALAADAARHVRRRGIAAVVERAPWILRRCPRRERRRLEAGQLTGDHIAGPVVSGPPAERRRPSLVVPCDDGAVGVDADALIDDDRDASVPP